jgi:hypothetical protein
VIVKRVADRQASFERLMEPAGLVTSSSSRTKSVEGTCLCHVLARKIEDSGDVIPRGVCAEAMSLNCGGR